MISRIFYNYYKKFMNCIICLEKMQDASTASPTSCCQKVLFHPSCIQEWLETCFLNPYCPWCKESLQDITDNVAFRSYTMLKNLVYKTDLVSEEVIQDEFGYFEIIHHQEENINTFYILFKNKLCFVFWYNKPVTIFSFSTFKNMIENTDKSVIKYSLGTIIAEAYFE